MDANPNDLFSLRIARLSGGVAIIQVGAQTETELKEKKLRVEDALNATKAAVEEGIVIGGGCTLLKLADQVDEIKETLENEEQMVTTTCLFLEHLSVFGTGCDNLLVLLTEWWYLHSLSLHAIFYSIC